MSTHVFPSSRTSGIWRRAGRLPASETQSRLSERSVSAKAKPIDSSILGTSFLDASRTASHVRRCMPNSPFRSSRTPCFSSLLTAWAKATSGSPSGVERRFHNAESAAFRTPMSGEKNEAILARRIHRSPFGRLAAKAFCVNCQRADGVRSLSFSIPSATTSARLSRRPVSSARHDPAKSESSSSNNEGTAFR